MKALALGVILLIGGIPTFAHAQQMPALAAERARAMDQEILRLQNAQKQNVSTISPESTPVYPEAGWTWASSFSDESATATSDRPAMEADLTLGTGYRVDDLWWTIAGDLEGANPNILSQLTWENLEIAQVKARGRVALRRFLVMRGYVNYGWIFNGDNQDSDYLGDERTFEFSRSNNTSDEGEVYDISLGLGYPFTPKSDPYRFDIDFLAGFSYHVQNLTITDGFQTIPRSGAFAGLDSAYETEWTGPWIGADLTLQPVEKWIFRAGFEFHLAKYKADARWNLRETFVQPKSFRHTADAYGVVGSVGLSYLLRKQWSLTASVDIQDWHTKNGLDRTYLTTGEIAYTRLNRVKWDSIAFMLETSYRF